MAVLKVLYILDEDISLNSGVLTKIDSMLKEWKSKGIETFVVSLRSGSFESSLENYKVLSLYDPKRTFLDNFFLNYKSFSKVKSIVENFQPDLIYARQIKYSPNMLNSFSNVPYVVEINTDDYEEMKLGSRLSFYLHRLTRTIPLANASGMVFVTNELKSNPKFRFDCKKVMIPNGVLNTSYIGAVNRSNNNVVFVGSPNMAWHGVDKILTMADFLPEFNFDIIGFSESDFENQRIPSNVRCHGYLSQEKIQKILDDATVAISTLALHRKGMEEACPLKSRHYALNGLPMLVGYVDPDMSDVDFCYNIGNYENNVLDNLEKIRTFFVAMQDYDNDKIVEFAQSHLTWAAKEKQRLAFFETIIGN